MHWKLRAAIAPLDDEMTGPPFLGLEGAASAGKKLLELLRIHAYRMFHRCVKVNTAVEFYKGSGTLMPSAKPIMFTRLADGTLLQRRPDGTFKPIRDKSDRERMARWTDAEIEKMAASDPDHPPLDGDFWKAAERLPRKEAISIKLDTDVLEYFRANGRGYQTRINAVLRRYMQAQRKAS